MTVTYPKIKNRLELINLLKPSYAECQQIYDISSEIKKQKVPEEIIGIIFSNLDAHSCFAFSEILNNRKITFLSNTVQAKQLSILKKMFELLASKVKYASCNKIVEEIENEIAILEKFNLRQAISLVDLNNFLEECIERLINILKNFSLDELNIINNKLQKLNVPQFALSISNLAIFYKMKQLNFNNNVIATQCYLRLQVDIKIPRGFNTHEKKGNSSLLARYNISRILGEIKMIDKSLDNFNSISSKIFFEKGFKVLLIALAADLTKEGFILKVFKSPIFDSEKRILPERELLNELYQALISVFIEKDQIEKAIRVLYNIHGTEKKYFSFSKIYYEYLNIRYEHEKALHILNTLYSENELKHKGTSILVNSLKRRILHQINNNKNGKYTR